MVLFLFRTSHQGLQEHWEIVDTENKQDDLGSLFKQISFKDILECLPLLYYIISWYTNSIVSSFPEHDRYIHTLSGLQGEFLSLVQTISPLLLSQNITTVHLFSTDYLHIISKMSPL